VVDGVLSHWSIGFREGQNARLSGNVTERVSAQLTETALVLEGAYGDLAAVAEVRERTGDEGTPNLDAARRALQGLPSLLPIS
jgi:hypothetical protein